MVLLLPLVAAAALASAQANPTTAPEREPFGPERRIFDIYSRDAWTVVQERLKERGFAVDKIDRHNQVLLTRWLRVSGRTAEWLPALQLPEPYVADQVRFQVFVSPFAEPARVYVGSLIKAVRSGWQQNAPTATVYNKVTANQALMAEIAQAVAIAALPKFVRNDADPCSERATTSGPGVRTGPKKIPLSVFEVLYPGPEKKGGRVFVELVILEDGGVANVRTLTPPVDKEHRFPRAGEQSEAAAMGAVSLLLWAPARIDGCPVRSILVRSFDFKPR